MCEWSSSDRCCLHINAANICASCDNGYNKNGDNCVRNTCTCPNGISSDVCPANRLESCEKGKCKAGYHTQESNWVINTGGPRIVRSVKTYRCVPNESKCILVDNFGLPNQSPVLDNKGDEIPIGNSVTGDQVDSEGNTLVPEHGMIRCAVNSCFSGFTESPITANNTLAKTYTLRKIQNTPFGRNLTTETKKLGEHFCLENKCNCNYRKHRGAKFNNWYKAGNSYIGRDYVGGGYPTATGTSLCPNHPSNIEDLRGSSCKTCSVPGAIHDSSTQSCNIAAEGSLGSWDQTGDNNESCGRATYTITRPAQNTKTGIVISWSDPLWASVPNKYRNATQAMHLEEKGCAKKARCTHINTNKFCGVCGSGTITTSTAIKTPAENGGSDVTCKNKTKNCGSCYSKDTHCTTSGAGTTKWCCKCCKGHYNYWGKDYCK